MIQFWGSWTWLWTLETDWGRLSGARAACCTLLGAERPWPLPGPVLPLLVTQRKSEVGAGTTKAAAAQVWEPPGWPAQQYTPGRQNRVRPSLTLCLGLKHKDSPRKARIQVVCSCGENDSWRCLQLPAEKTTAKFNSTSRTVCFLPAKSRPTPPKPASPTSPVRHRGSRAKSASHLLKSNHYFLFPL